VLCRIKDRFDPQLAPMLDTSPKPLFSEAAQRQLIDKLEQA
jgi:hypothetical protein